MYYSSDGQSWTLHDSATFTMGNDVYIGMAVTAYDNTQLSTATFTDVTVTGGSSPTATASVTLTPLPATATNTPLPATATPTAVGGGSRVTDGIQVLYTFYEGSGTDVYDISGVGTALDLSIDNSSNVSWLTGGGLSIDTSTVITGSVATKVIDAVKGSNAISVEAWVNPANLTQEGPARIVSISGGSTPDLYNVRLRTGHWTISDNGSPALEGSVSSATTNLTHVVYTWESSGTATLYINGVVDTTDTVPGGSGKLSNWDDGYPLLLGNETTGDRPWLGELHLVAPCSGEVFALRCGRRPASPLSGLLCG